MVVLFVELSVIDCIKIKIQESAPDFCHCDTFRHEQGAGDGYKNKES